MPKKKAIDEFFMMVAIYFRELCVSRARAKEFKHLVFHYPPQQQFGKSSECKAIGMTNTCIVGHYNPSVRIIDLASHATCVVCISFIHKRPDVQFKVDTKRQIFLRIFFLMTIFI